MRRILTWLTIGIVFTAGGHGLVCQTVKLLADVDVRYPLGLIAYYTRASVDGKFIAVANDTVGVIRVQTYPTERRDTVAIPDSVMKVRCIGFFGERLLVAYVLRATGFTYFATIDTAGKEWAIVPDVLPSVHPRLGKLDSYIQCVTAPGQNTAVLYGRYMRASLETFQKRAKNEMFAKA